MALFVDIRKKLGEFLLDVRFEAGDEILALLGSSGCGKSVTLKCIAGVIRPDEGRIVLDGRPLFDSKRGINLSPQKRGVGLLFQNYALFPNMTVAENILSVLRKKRKEESRRELDALLEKFYLRGLEEHYPSQLSGGQQQRAALARILASRPSLIMLDEPLSALDSYLRWQLEMELVRLLEQFEGTTLYVSHNRSEVYRICDRVCVMHQGLSEPVSSVRELFEEPKTLASALLSGCKNYSRVERLGERTVLAHDWGALLTCGTAVPEDARYIGVRAHYILPCEGPGENILPCSVLRVTKDLFSTIITIRPKRSEGDTGRSAIRMELSKEQGAAISEGDDIFVHIRPEDVMPLRRERESSLS